jgi:hypothetical protein
MPDGRVTHLGGSPSGLLASRAEALPHIHTDLSIGWVRSVSPSVKPNTTFASMLAADHLGLAPAGRLTAVRDRVTVRSV